jgi:class 3 adenylate cyclase
MTAKPEGRATRELIIVFLDLSFYTQDARRMGDDGRLAGIVDGYYERVAQRCSAAGGTVVKFIGDGALIVFPIDPADAAVQALFQLKSEVDDWLATLRWESRLVVKAHCGSVVAGPFGGHDEKRFDIIGDEVNVTARLPTRSFALSAEAFRRLSPDARKRFKKHTPPITYIPVEDRRPSNVAKS